MSVGKETTVVLFIFHVNLKWNQTWILFIKKANKQGENLQVRRNENLVQP